MLQYNLKAWRWKTEVEKEEVQGIIDKSYMLMNGDWYCPAQKSSRKKEWYFLKTYKRKQTKNKILSRGTITNF